MDKLFRSFLFVAISSHYPYNPYMIATGKKIILVFLLTAFFICFPITTKAEDNNINFQKETINPGSLYYSLKRLWEKGMNVFQFSEQAKINYEKSLLKIRLSELDYVVNNRILSEIQSSSQRVSYQAGILAEDLLKQNQPQVKEEAIKEFEKYSKFLLILRDNFENSNSSFWRLIQYDVESLKILSDRLR